MKKENTFQFPRRLDEGEQFRHRTQGNADEAGIKGETGERRSSESPRPSH